MVAVDVHPADFGTAAAKLLVAAEELGLSPAVVATTSDGLFGMGFVVPEEVAAKAGFAVAEQDSVAEEPVPVKRGPGRPRKVVQE